MVSTLSNLLATAIVLGGLLLRFTVVPSGLVSEDFLEVVGTVAFMAGLALLVFIALAAALERRSAHERPSRRTTGSTSAPPWPPWRSSRA
jgi:hypothetical protein